VTDVERLFRTYNAALVRYLTRRLGDRDWAEEVAQETFVRALRQTSIQNERAWLFAVATNLVRDEARKDMRRRKHLALLAEQERDSMIEPEETTLERAQEAAIGSRCSCGRKDWIMARSPRRWSFRRARWERRSRERVAD
jgi:RNA polymerase sigma-70 factor (ECF subfamily)